jgi:diguanylate cyclase (GGDEF)-like protein
MPHEWAKIEPMKKLADLVSLDDMGEILEYIHAMVALVERDGTLVSWNPAFESYKETSPLAENLQDCFTQKEKAKIHGQLSMNRQDRFVIEFGVDEKAKTMFCDCVLIPLADDRSLFIAERFDADSSMQEIVQRLNRRVKMFQVESEHAKKIARNKQTEVEGIMVQANELSNVDALTFLSNRRMIVRALQDEVLRAQRYAAPFSVSVLDVDFFKKVNDTYGHIVGDEVLRRIADQLRNHIRHPDLVGRYGGEEFLILFRGRTAAEVLPFVEAVRQEVAEAGFTPRSPNRLAMKVEGAPPPPHPIAPRITITISIGLADTSKGRSTPDLVLDAADLAMYQAKDAGRNCVRVFS